MSGLRLLHKVSGDNDLWKAKVGITLLCKALQENMLRALAVAVVQISTIQRLEHSLNHDQVDEYHSSDL